MSILKRSISIALSTILVLGLTACSGKTEDKNSEEVIKESSSSHYPVTITTYNYEKEPVEITFEKEPEIKLAAGLDHDVKDEYKEAFSKINYSKEFTPDKETVIMSQPDFILSWYSLFADKNLGDVDYWHENGTNTYMSLNSGAASDRTVENEITDILNLGKIFNVEEKAQALVDEINKGIDSVVSKVNNQKKQTTLIIEYMDGQIYTYGAKTLGGDMISKLGGELLNPEGGNISEEDLVKLNPDSIFVVYMDRNDKTVAQGEVDKVLKNPALASLDAVKNKRVNSIALGEMYSSGIRTIDGINTFANGLYPQLNN